MGLSNKKEQQLKSMPLIQNKVKTSRNGRYLIQQTVITTIKPIEYYRAILANTVKVTEEPLGDDEFLLEDGLEIARRLK